MAAIRAGRVGQVGQEAEAWQGGGRRAGRRCSPSASDRPTVRSDREVLGISAGDPRLDHASVDLHVSAVSTGFGRTPFTLRVLANGQLLDTRRIVPAADGSPIDEVFTVSPDPLNPTVYTAEIARDENEAVVENNTRSVLVSPAGRKRRLLIVEGAPGYEHSFLTRAWTADPGLEVDSVTRKGKNADGQDTFFVQAGAGRSRRADQRVSGEARAALRLRRAGDRQRRRRLLLARAARPWRPTSSPSAAAACWCSAADRSRSAACPARRSRKCCRWS